MSEKAFKKLSRQYHLGTEQFDELLGLLQAGQSPFYILRYRKELAANLSARDLDDIAGEARRLESLEKEKQKILKKLQDQGILNEELQGKIDGAETLRELIDYYVPFRPRKRSRSRQALEQGLEPLARKVFAQQEAISLMSDAAAPHVDPEKGLKDAGEVLDGVFHIVCDWLAEEKSHRDKQRELVREQGTVVSHRTGESAPAWLRNEFKDYFEFESKLKALRAHQFLRLMRGRRLKIIQFSIRPPLDAMCQTAAELYMAGVAEEFNRIDSSFAGMETIPEGEKLGELTGSEFLYFCIRRSLSGILAPILTRELERELAKEAEALALDMVRRRMRSALMTRPMKGRRVLAVCPGYRTGCKLAALDESGAVLESCIVYPHTPQLDVAGAKSKILELIQKHGLTVAVLGDGTASAETETLLSEIIAESCREFRYAVLDEEAANAYAGSAVAERELPGMGADIQKAVFLGREFLEPLLELSKVNLRALCPAYYAADVGIAALKKAISRVLGECVAEVGVELNSAPISLLKHAPGLNIVTAQEILGYRAAKGPFAGRGQLRDVPKIEEETWRQAVGFVKVASSTNPLDITRIHPDNYPVATAILGLLGVQSGNLGDEQVREEIKKRCAEVNIAEMEKQFGVHYLLVKSILDELSEPWPDPRLQAEGRVLRERPLAWSDLQIGQTLPGTVRKVVDFGVFVDIGLEEDGLVHISELSEHFVRSPYDVVNEGDTIRVRVVEVDREKRRIALSMRPAQTGKPPAKSAPRRRPEEHAPGRPAGVAPNAGPPRGPRPAQSAAGARSRRVERAASYKAPRQPQRRVAKPRAEEPAANKEPASPQEKAALSDLLKKLDIAAIERRGKPSG